MHLNVKQSALTDDPCCDKGAPIEYQASHLRGSIPHPKTDFFNELCALNSTNNIVDKICKPILSGKKHTKVFIRYWIVLHLRSLPHQAEMQWLANPYRGARCSQWLSGLLAISSDAP